MIVTVFKILKTCSVFYLNGLGVPGFSKGVSMQLSTTRDQNRAERSRLLVVSQNEIEEEFLMFQGVWTVTIDCESKYMLMVSISYA
jgi:hypothetical protein